MKYIDTEKLISKIKAEIERLIERYGSVKTKGVLQEGYKGGRLIGYEDAINILKRIQEKAEEDTPSDLEEAAEEYCLATEMESPYVRRLKSQAFKSGSRWQKEQMMKEAEECELYCDGYFLAIDLNMTALGYSEHDKVRVIILKEDKK